MPRRPTTADVEVWKQFAASQDIRIDTSREDVVWLTATKVSKY